MIGDAGNAGGHAEARRRGGRNAGGTRRRGHRGGCNVIGVFEKN